MLLAEALVLLALNPDGTLARGASSQPAVAIGVTGALVAELALGGHVDLTDGRIRLTGTRPDHPLLAQALDNLAPHEGKKLQSRLASIKHAGWKEVIGAMMAAGLLGHEKRPLRPTRHPVLDRARHAAIICEVRDAAAGTGPIPPRTAALLALAGPSQLLEVVAPERADRPHARERIAQAAEQVPAAAAVKHVIRSIEAAIAAAAMMPAVTGGS